MNYQRIYDEIINNAKSRGLNKKLLDGYFERHHIVPKCLNGTNDKDNLVLLTAREHYLCHWLLVKIHKDDNTKRKMNYALLCMIQNNRFQNRNINSKAYEFARLTYSKVGISNETKIKISKANTGKTRSEEAKLKAANSNRGKKRSIDAIERTAKANKGRKNSIESKERISKVMKGKYFGSNNPNFGKTDKTSANYGRKWFHNKNGERIYKVPSEVDKDIWILGMK